MTDLNDEQLSAFLDGELDELTRATVEQALAADPGARVRLERMRQMDALLRSAIPEPLARDDDPLVARITADDGAVQRTVWPQRFRLQAAAALLVAGVCGMLVGRSLPSTPQSPVEVAGSLLQALERQASGGGDDAGLRIILSTRVRDGRYCRQFALRQEQLVGEGLACRRANTGWQLVAWEASAAGAPGFQPAGASELLDAALDRLGAGEALDAGSERALIARDWAQQ